jgi:hypothetical protein
MKIILVTISSSVEPGLGYWIYTHYVQFSHVSDYKYSIRCGKEVFGHTVKIWREAGYKVMYENEYPK